MKAYGGSECTDPHFPDLGTKLEVSGQLHAPEALPQGKSSGTHWIGGWVGPRAGLE
jgi:hypothetical protein